MHAALPAQQGSLLIAHKHKPKAHLHTCSSLWCPCSKPCALCCGSQRWEQQAVKLGLPAQQFYWPLTSPSGPDNKPGTPGPTFKEWWPDNALCPTSLVTKSNQIKFLKRLNHTQWCQDKTLWLCGITWHFVAFLMSTAVLRDGLQGH